MTTTLSAAQLERMAFDAARVRIVDKLACADGKTITLVSEMLEIRDTFESDTEHGRALALRDLQSEQPCDCGHDDWFMRAYHGEIGTDMQIVANRSITAHARLIAQREIDRLFVQKEEVTV